MSKRRDSLSETEAGKERTPTEPAGLLGGFGGKTGLGGFDETAQDEAGNYACPKDGDEDLLGARDEASQERNSEEREGHEDPCGRGHTEIVGSCRRLLDLSRERYGSRSGKRLRQASEHHEVSVKADALKPSHSKWREAVVVFQVSERPLHRGAVPIERLEPLRVSRDAREQTTADPDGHGWLPSLRTTQRNDGLYVAFLGTRPSRRTAIVELRKLRIHL